MPPQNVIIHQEGKKNVANVIKKCDEESHKKLLLLPINKATEWAAVYVGKPLSSILRTRRRHKERTTTIQTQHLKLPGLVIINLGQYAP